ncbi:ATP synthase subunit B' [Thalassospira australica]|uniref:F0F1 ATP synthase subunit B family protein n=1 Tax=Thalassospira australica TaxID=1528106 RepID=UPI00051A85FF|nr:ATP synthase subunit B' [Thalassospira australica]
MPQFDIATFSEQIFWLFVIFTILYFLMSKIALPKVGEVLERRQKNIEDNLGKARALKDETDAAIAKYEAALAEARDAAQADIREASEKAAAEQAKKTEAMVKKLSKKTSDAEKAIADAKTDAMTGVAEAASEIAREATDKLIGVKVQAKTADKAVSAIVGE